MGFSTVKKCGAIGFGITECDLNFGHAAAHRWSEECRYAGESTDYVLAGLGLRGQASADRANDVKDFCKPAADRENDNKTPFHDATITKECEYLVDQINKLSAQIDKERKDSRKESETLTGEVIRLSCLIDKERKDAKKWEGVLRDTIAIQEYDIKNEIKRVKALDAEVTRLKGETCRACSSEIAARDSEVKSLRDDNERIVKNVNALVKQVHDLADANARIAKMASDDDATWSMRVRDLNRDHKETVDRLNKSDASWVNRYGDLCMSLTEANATARALRLANDNLIARIKTLEQEITVIRNKNLKPGIPSSLD